MSLSKPRWRWNPDRFRFLIIGRVNAGKTTILQSQSRTQTYDSARTKHGVHDIKNQMMFPLNPIFVFHASCGFEAGGYSECDEVKAFIARRSKNKRLNDQIHDICTIFQWMRLPVFSRKGKSDFSLTGALGVFFDKCDALYDDARTEPISMGVSKEDAQAPQDAREIFASGPQLRLLYNRCKGNRRPPKYHTCLVHMDDFHNEGYEPLIERTAEALDDTLK